MHIEIYDTAFGICFYHERFSLLNMLKCNTNVRSPLLTILHFSITRYNVNLPSSINLKTMENNFTKNKNYITIIKTNAENNVKTAENDVNIPDTDVITAENACHNC